MKYNKKLRSEPLTWLLNSLKECPFLCPFFSLSFALSPFLSSFFEFFSFFQSFFIYSFLKKMKLSQLRDSVNTQEKTSTNTLITIGLKKSLTKIEFVKIPMAKLKEQNLNPHRPVSRSRGSLFSIYQEPFLLKQSMSSTWSTIELNSVAKVAIWYNEPNAKCCHLVECISCRVSSSYLRAK